MTTYIFLLTNFDMRWCCIVYDIGIQPKFLGKMFINIIEITNLKNK